VLIRKEKSVEDEGLEDEYDGDNKEMELHRRRKAIEELAAELETEEDLEMEANLQGETDLEIETDSEIETDLEIGSETEFFSEQSLREELEVLKSQFVKREVDE
jgi:hypothetical protein